MKIGFYANLRSITNQARLDLSSESFRTLRQLFNYLVKLYPEIWPQLFDEYGKLRQDVPIFVNGRNPRLMDAGLDLVLMPEDEISLFSPISSGRMNVEVLRSPSSNEQEKTR